MSVHIKCDSNFAMSHQVLQCLGVHACLCLIAAIGVAADMRRDIRHLNAIDIVVFADHVVEAVFPVHCDQRHAVIVNIQETAVTVHKFLSLGFHSVLNDRPKAVCHILGDWNLSRTRACFGRLNDILHILCALKFIVDVHNPVFKVNILQRQPAEFRDSHSGMKQNVDRFIVFAVGVVIVYEFQELPHLLFRNCFSGLAVVDDHTCKLEPEGF